MLPTQQLSLQTLAGPEHHGQSAWLFTGMLWLLRWLVILPLNWIASFVFTTGGGESVGLPGNPLVLLMLLVLVAPLIEALFECSLPYWALGRFRKPVPPWLFITISASLMGLLHMVSLMAVINALITGAFIAYIYARHAPRRTSTALLHACAFHGAINAIGWMALISG